MVHVFQMKDKYIALDVNSGCVHVLDRLCYDILRYLCETEQVPEEAVFPAVIRELGGE